MLFLIGTIKSIYNNNFEKINMFNLGNPWTQIRDSKTVGSGSGHSGQQLLPDAQVVRVSRGRTAAIKCHLPRYADTGPNLTVSFIYYF